MHTKRGKAYARKGRERKKRGSLGSPTNFSGQKRSDPGPLLKGAKLLEKVNQDQRGKPRRSGANC